MELVGVKRHRGGWQVDLRSHYVGVYPDERTARAIFGHGEHLVMLGRPLPVVIDELRGRTPKGPAPTLGQRAEVWLSRRTISAESVSKYRANLERCAPMLACRIDLITRDDVSALVGRLSDTYAPKTVHDTIATLKAVLDDAMRAGLIERNPADRLDNLPRIRNVRPPHAITRAEYAKLVTAAPPAMTPLVAVLPLTGLRISEACGLEWDDIHLDSPTPCLTVSRQFARGRVKAFPKTDAGRRVVELTPDAVSWLQMQRALCPEGCAPVFPGPTGGHLRYDAVSALFALLRKCTAIDVRPHDLRHTYGSWLLKSGVDVVYVSARMGHADPSFTLRVYAHELAEHDPTAIEEFQEWMSRGQNGDNGAN